MKKNSIFTASLFSSFMFLSVQGFAQETVPVKSVQALTPAQTEAVKKIIRDYLIDSPEVLIEASKSLQEKQKQRMQEDAEKGIKKNFKKLVENKTSLVVGNPAGSVVLVEFLDYQCGHCKTMSAAVDELSKKNKDLKVIIKQLPIFGEKSEFAAKAALASVKQSKEKFLAFHKALFGSKSRLSEKVVMDLAKASHLDESQLRQDINDPLIKQELSENIKLAGELKLPGTPAFLIANIDGSEAAFIPGAIPKPVEEFQTLIDKARKVKNKEVKSKEG